MQSATPWWLRRGKGSSLFSSEHCLLLYFLCSGVTSSCFLYADLQASRGEFECM